MEERLFNIEKRRDLAEQKLQRVYDLRQQKLDRRQSLNDKFRKMTKNQEKMHHSMLEYKKQLREEHMIK